MTDQTTPTTTESSNAVIAATTTESTEATTDTTTLTPAEQFAAHKETWRTAVKQTADNFTAILPYITAYEKFDKHPDKFMENSITHMREGINVALKSFEQITSAPPDTADQEFDQLLSDTELLIGRAKGILARLDAITAKLPSLPV